jgi:hypothetical protein
MEKVDAPSTSTEGDSVSNDILAAIESLEGGEEAAVEEVTEPTQVEEPIEEAPTENTDLSDQTGEVEPEVVEAISEEEVVEELPPIEYPSSWSAEISEKVDGLPRELQEWMADHERKRQADYTQKSQELARVNRYYEGIERSLDPYKEQIQLAGKDPAQVVSQLLAAQSMLDRDPSEGLRWIAQTYGLDLGQVAQETPYTDPRVAELNGRIQELESRIADSTTGQEEAETQQILSDIEAFQAATDESGNKLYPHYNELENEIAAFVNVLKPQMQNASNNEILSAAYERAYRANPRTSKMWLKSQQIEAAKARTAKAQKASGQINGAPGGGVTETVPDSIRGMLESMLD